MRGLDITVLRLKIHVFFWLAGVRASTRDGATVVLLWVSAGEWGLKVSGLWLAVKLPQTPPRRPEWYHIPRPRSGDVYAV